MAPRREQEKELLALSEQYGWTQDQDAREDIRQRYRALHAAWMTGAPRPPAPEPEPVLETLF